MFEDYLILISYFYSEGKWGPEKAQELPKVSPGLVRGKAECRSLFLELLGWFVLSTEIVFYHLVVAQDCPIPFSLVEFSWHYPSRELKKTHSNFVTDLPLSQQIDFSLLAWF